MTGSTLLYYNYTAHSDITEKYKKCAFDVLSLKCPWKLRVNFGFTFFANKNN
jgi:hypothetical protein